RCVLGLAFVWAAIIKLMDPPAFKAAVEAYRLPAPHLLSQLAAFSLPWIELATGGLLLVGVWVEKSLICSVVLLALFSIATGQAWIRGLQVSCGCFSLGGFGVEDKFSNLVKLFDSVGFAFCRDLVLITLAGFLLAQRRAFVATSRP